MRYIARHEGAGAWPANCDCVADLEGDLAAQDLSDLVAVVMKMHRGHGADGCHLLECQHALVGLAVPQLEGGRAAGPIFHAGPFPGITTKRFASITASESRLVHHILVNLDSEASPTWNVT